MNCIGNNKTYENISAVLESKIGNCSPIFVCVGSDLVLGDSLGPLVGTFIKNKKLSAYVYGTLNFPVTAKEIDYVRKYIKIMHPHSKIVAIDAALGKEEEIGCIKINNGGLKPGLGVNKNIDEIGDVSIIGIVASKSDNNVNLFNYTRLNMVYKLAEIIADSIEEYILRSRRTNEERLCAF